MGRYPKKSSTRTKTIEDVYKEIREDEEQYAFVEWLQKKRIKHSAIPNSTYTPHPNQWSKNKKLGLTPGLPDLLIFIDRDRSITERAILLFVEMKRLRGGVVSEYQKEWIECLNQVKNVEAAVCNGCGDAIRFIEQYIRK